MAHLGPVARKPINADWLLNVAMLRLRRLEVAQSGRSIATFNNRSALTGFRRATGPYAVCNLQYMLLRHDELTVLSHSHLVQFIISPTSNLLALISAS